MRQEEAADTAEEYPVTVFLARDGYFKKITPQSLRVSGEQKLKEGDEIRWTMETSNLAELLLFSTGCQVYKARICDFEDSKASLLGEYLPARLGVDEGESIAFATVTADYAGNMLFFFQNGRAAKVGLDAYATKQHRKKLVGAYSDKSPLVAAFHIRQDAEFALTSSAGRVLLVHSGAIPLKATRSTQGIHVMTLKPGRIVTSVAPYAEGRFHNPHRYRVRSLPGTGMLPRPEDTGGEQLRLK